jgi:hypothetical protein
MKCNNFTYCTHCTVKYWFLLEFNTILFSFTSRFFLSVPYFHLIAWAVQQIFIAICKVTGAGNIEFEQVGKENDLLVIKISR